MRTESLGGEAGVRNLRVAGIDPSSTYCGLAVVDSSQPDWLIAAHWTRNKNRSHPQGFKDYFYWLSLKLADLTPDMAVIEFGAVGQGAKANFQAAQAVAFYQAISALCCKLNGIVVIESRATTVRKAVLGNGGLSKDKVWEIMRKRYPGLFAPKTSGGLDECDALVLALAGETVAER